MATSSEVINNMTASSEVIKKINDTKQKFYKTFIYNVDFNDKEVLKIINKRQHNKIRNSIFELTESQQEIPVYFCKKLNSKKDKNYINENGEKELGGDGIF